MRCLDRDRRWVLLSRFEGLEPSKDEQGRLTGRHETVRSRQVPVLASVSGAKGSAETAVFGQSLDYDRSVLIDDPAFDVDEASVFWLDPDVAAALLDGGYFDGYSVYESGSDIDGGTFDDDVEDDADGGGFGYPTFVDEPFDHVVKKVARTPNYTLVALKHVEVSK